MNLEITVQDLAQRLKTPTPPLLLDVRQPEEYALAHLEGAQLIPLGELANRMSEIPAGDLIVYCHSGRRSLTAASMLISKGRQAVSLRGGIDAWSREIDPSIPRY
jgi:rhodanese-related sulfurtransferase